MSNEISVITDEQSFKIFKTLKNDISTKTKHQKYIRNATMILLMLDAGLRVGEVVKLTRGCLIFANHFCDSVTVPASIAKNKIERTIPFTMNLKNQIQEMSYHVWQPQDVRSEQCAFFVKNPDKPLTTRQVERILEKASSHGCGVAINPHMLRHTFATRLMQKVSIRLVQELLGHKSIASTQIYTHPNSDDLKNAIQTLDTGHQRAN